MSKPDATVEIDPETRTMHLSLSPGMQADIFADVLMSEHPGDPVEGARNVWNLVAPSLRKLGWSDQRIIETYRIPDEVLSGEAERRATVRWGLYRLTWIEGERGSLFRGEGALLAALRSGGITEEQYALGASELCAQRHRRWPDDREIPPVPESDLRQTVGDGGEDWLELVCDHVPTGRRWTMKASRKYLADHERIIRQRIGIDLCLLGLGEEPLCEDNFTPEAER